MKIGVAYNLLQINPNSFTFILNNQTPINNINQQFNLKTPSNLFGLDLGLYEHVNKKGFIFNPLNMQLLFNMRAGWFEIGSGIGYEKRLFNINKKPLRFRTGFQLGFDGIRYDIYNDIKSNNGADFYFESKNLSNKISISIINTMFLSKAYLGFNYTVSPKFELRLIAFYNYTIYSWEHLNFSESKLYLTKSDPPESVDDKSFKYMFDANGNSITNKLLKVAPLTFKIEFAFSMGNYDY